MIRLKNDFLYSIKLLADSGLFDKRFLDDLEELLEESTKIKRVGRSEYILKAGLMFEDITVDTDEDCRIQDTIYLLHVSRQYEFFIPLDLHQMHRIYDYLDL
jgi:hypothetical protein